MGVGDCMRLKLLILRWIDYRGDGDGNDGNNPPVLSRLQFFEGFVEGMDEEGTSGMKRIDKRGGRERKKSTRPKLAR